MDMDATVKGMSVNSDTMMKMFEEICAIEINDDVTFTIKRIEEIREIISDCRRLRRPQERKHDGYEEKILGDDEYDQSEFKNDYFGDC